MSRREQLVQRLAKLSHGRWDELWLNDDSPIFKDPQMLEIAEEADACRYLELLRRKYAKRPRGEYLFLAWARDRVGDLLRRGMTPEAVLERLREPAQLSALLPGELESIVAKASRARGAA